MKKRTLLRFSIVVALALLIIIGGNVQALSQLTIYLPFVVKETLETPSPTTPPTATATATSTQPQPPAITGIVEIRDIVFNESGSTEPDEYVVIENDDSVPIQLKNWTKRDEANHIFTFPSFVIQPNQTCRVYTNEIHSEWCGFSYGSGKAIWNNGGDTAYLRDAYGTIINEYSY